MGSPSVGASPASTASARSAARSSTPVPAALAQGFRPAVIWHQLARHPTPYSTVRRSGMSTLALQGLLLWIFEICPGGLETRQLWGLSELPFSIRAKPMIRSPGPAKLYSLYGISTKV